MRVAKARGGRNCAIETGTRAGSAPSHANLTLVIRLKYADVTHARRLFRP